MSSTRPMYSTFEGPHPTPSRCSRKNPTTLHYLPQCYNLSGIDHASLGGGTLESRVSFHGNVVGGHAKHALRHEQKCGVPDSHCRISVGLDSGRSTKCTHISHQQSAEDGGTDLCPLRSGDDAPSQRRRSEDSVVTDARQPGGCPQISLTGWSSASLNLTGQG